MEIRFGKKGFEEKEVDPNEIHVQGARLDIGGTKTTACTSLDLRPECVIFAIK